MLPHQTIALDEDYVAQHPPVIDPSLPAGLQKDRSKPLHLLVCQPVKLTHNPSQAGSLNHAACRRSSGFMGPDSIDEQARVAEEVTALIVAWLADFAVLRDQARACARR